METADDFIVNPEITSVDAYDAATLRLEQAQALLAVHCYGCQGYLDFTEHSPAIVSSYVGAIETLVNDARTLLAKSREAKGGKQ